MTANGQPCDAMLFANVLDLVSAHAKQRGKVVYLDPDLGNELRDVLGKLERAAEPMPSKTRKEEP